MLLSIVLSALSLFLFVLCLIEIYKNFMKERRSISGFKLIISIILIIIILYYSLTTTGEAFALQHLIRILDNPDNYDPEIISTAKEAIPGIKDYVIRALIYGYTIYVIEFIYIKLIRRAVDTEIATNKKGKWTFK